MVISYLCRDLSCDRIVILQEFFPEGQVVRNHLQSNTVAEAHFQEKAMERFLEKADILSRYGDDPCIQQIKDFFRDNNTAYLVAENPTGITISRYLEKKGAIPAEALLRLMKPALQLLDELHEKGVLHRNISPDTIMIYPDGTVKLVDFAMPALPDPLSPYAAPEQFESLKQCGPWSDVYALCAALYKSITNHAPQPALERRQADGLMTPSSLGAEVDDNTQAAMLMGLALDRQDRLLSIKALMRAMGLLEIADEAVEATEAVSITREREQMIFTGMPVLEEASEEEEKLIDPVDLQGKVPTYTAPMAEYVPEPAPMPEPVFVPEPASDPAPVFEAASAAEPASVPEPEFVPEPTAEPETIVMPEPEEAPIFEGIQIPDFEPITIPDLDSIPIPELADLPTYEPMTIPEFDGAPVPAFGEDETTQVFTPVGGWPGSGQMLPEDPFYDRPPVEEKPRSKKKTALIAAICVLVVLLAGLVGLSIYLKNGHGLPDNAATVMLEEGLTFTLDGQSYEMPVQVSKLQENGWSMSKKIKGIDAAEQMQMEMTKGDHIVHVVIQNTEMKKTPVEDCVVTSLTVYHGQADLELPEGITTGSTVREAKKTFGKTEENSDGALHYDGKAGIVELLLEQEKQEDNRIIVAAKDFLEE